MRPSCMWRNHVDVPTPAHSEISVRECARKLSTGFFSIEKHIHIEAEMTNLHHQAVPQARPLGL